MPTEAMVLWATLGAVCSLLHINGITHIIKALPFVSRNSDCIDGIVYYGFILILLFYATILSIVVFEHRAFFTVFVYPSLFYGIAVFGLVQAIRNQELVTLPFTSVTLVVLALFFTFSFNGDAIQLAAGRFLRGWLASDNTLPWILAKGIYTFQGDALPQILFADWKAGDRPPGYTAALMLPLSFFGGQNPIGPYFEYLVPIYTASSIILNAIYIVPVYLLLRERFDNHSASWLTVALMFMPVMLVNQVYAWPKNFSMFFILSALYLTGKGRVVTAWLAATLAFLSHGNSIYLLIPLGIILLFRHPKHSIAGVALSLSAYLPWALIQKFIFPPGDRLIKYHLADVQVITENSALETIYNAYNALTIADWFLLKINNVTSLLGWPYLKSWQTEAVMPTGWAQFVYLTPALMPMIFGLAIMFSTRYLASVSKAKNVIALSGTYSRDFPSTMIADLRVLFWSGVLAGVMLQFGGQESQLTNITMNTATVAMIFILFSHCLKYKLEVKLTALSIIASSLASIHLFGPPDKAFIFVTSSILFWLMALVALWILFIKRTKSIRSI